MEDRYSAYFNKIPRQYPAQTLSPPRPYPRPDIIPAQTLSGYCFLSRFPLYYVILQHGVEAIQSVNLKGTSLCLIAY